jgi:hypothetical protein
MNTSPRAQGMRAPYISSACPLHISGDRRHLDGPSARKMLAVPSLLR